SASPGSDSSTCRSPECCAALNSTSCKISSGPHSARIGAMFDVFWLWIGTLITLFRFRRSLLIENLALRQQLAVFKRRHSRRRLAALDKLFWVILRRFWPSWKKTLIVVTPDTVVRWHRAGFRLYWRLISRVRRPLGRRPVTQETRELI